MRPLALTLALALGGCFEAPDPPCAFSCRLPPHACPIGYVCGDDRLCRKPGAPAECPSYPAFDAGMDARLPVDSAPADRPRPDAAPDAAALPSG